MDPAGPTGSPILPEIDFGDAVLTPARGEDPKIASSDSQHFVTWTDRRAGRNQAYGARVAFDGTVLDPYGIKLIDGANVPILKAAASNGASFLVALEDCSPGGICGIQGVRVDANGEVKAPGLFPIFTGQQNVVPAAASDGTRYLVAWQHTNYDDPAQSGIRASRISAGGDVLDTLALPFSAQGQSLNLAFDGDHYLLTWIEGTAGGTQVRGARISPQGAVLDPAGFAISPVFSPASWALALSFDGESSVVAWAEVTELESFRVKAARVSPAGAVLDAGGVLVAEHSSSYEYVGSFAAAFDGTATVLAWSWASGECPYECWAPVEVARIDPSGALLGGSTYAIENGKGVAAAPTGGGGVLLSAGWNDPTEFPQQYLDPIVGVRLDSQGALLDAPTGIPLATQAAPQEVRGVASDGQQLFVIWEEERSAQAGGPGLFGARVTAAGVRLEPGIRIASGRIIEEASVTFDGANFVVVWGEYQPDTAGAVRLARVSPGGALLDAAPIALDLHYEEEDAKIALASDGAGTLLVLDQYDYSDYALVALRVGQDGAAGARHAFAPHDRWMMPRPALAFDGAGYLVSWADHEAVQALRLDAEGAPIDPAPFAIASLAGTGERQPPALAFGGGSYFAVWHDEGEVRGARVSPAGQVLDPGGVLLGPANPLHVIGAPCTWLEPDQPCPAVTFDGSRFVVAWQGPAASAPGAPADLLGARVSPAGQVLSTFLLSGKKDIEGLPALASAGGKTLAAYTRFVPGAPHQALQARARLLQ